MAVHKLILDNDFDEEPYTLIGIHCALEDYRMAYLLNKQLDIQLERKRLDLDFKRNKTNYPIFEWHDEKLLTTWNLVSNICKKEVSNLGNQASLFNDQDVVVSSFNLIPEYKRVNYFLKIEHEFNLTKEKYLTNLILEIPQVVTAYSIDASQLKSKNNLIFS